MDSQKLILNWQGIDIHIHFIGNYSKVIKAIQGFNLAHIEVKANEPLPLTERGYRSIFLPFNEVFEQGGVVPFITKALDETAQSSKWKRYWKERQQLSLF
ncbi:MAG: hypothetical protein DWQ02_12150 [Bacteroidetes bacterium]|nr:MAG: hypothetical protein DWQ02_12150 [Bacteroidota bacterium]